MGGYRDNARPQLEELKAFRSVLGDAHPIYRCVRVIVHLAWRGPHENVGWADRTTSSVPPWAEKLGIFEGTPIPDALATAFRGIRQEIHQARGSVSDDVLDSLETLVLELATVFGLETPARQPEEPVLDWPTIEWVKFPVDLKTGEPSGSPIKMRHFAHCSHWYPDDDGGLKGDLPFLASDEQMTSLPPCKDCANQAKRAEHAPTGPRVRPIEPSGTADDPEPPMPLLLDIDSTDTSAVVLVRVEQARLRQALLSSNDENRCALCGRHLPDSLLVAAHIVPRRLLDDAARLFVDSVALPACSLGCDALFELGYVVVGADGIVAAGRPASGALAESINAIAGCACLAFNPKTAANFERHATLHA